MKKTKASVNYSRGDPQEHCSICKHYINDDRCELVKGQIASNYWCKLFKRSK